MELLRVIKDKTYDDVKDLLTKTPYYIQVKESIQNPNIYMLVYQKDKSDFNIPLVSECRGIILEKNTNKVLCYTFDRKQEFNWDSDNTSICQSVDGSQLKLYYYNDEWMISTTRCIDADKSFWYSEKSFKELFDECLNESIIDYDKLNKEYCYSFVLCHKENRIVIKHNMNHLVHVLTRDLSKDNYPFIDVDVGITKPEKVNIDNHDEIDKMISNNKTLEGLFMWRDGKHCKLKFDYYTNIKKLRSNSRDLLYEYIHNVCTGNKDMYISEYDEYKDNFKLYENRLSNIINRIHYNYMEYFVHKNIILKQVNKVYHKHLYGLHGIYKKDGTKITKEVVRNYVLSLDAKQIMHIINIIVKRKKYVTNNC
jgi:hypothetical protein